MNTEMNFEVTDYRKIPDSDCIEDVIAVSKKIGKRTVKYEEYLKYGKYHYSTLIKKFGTWNQVLKKAGLEISRRRWKWKSVAEKEEHLFENLAAVWIKLGRQPKFSEMKYPFTQYGASIYLRHFGTWFGALHSFCVYKKNKCAEDKQKQHSANEDAVNLPPEKTAECPLVDRDRRFPSPRLKINVFARDGYRCTCCGKSPATHPGVVLHCHHIIPWSKGGRTTFENLTTLCSECNIGIGDRMMEWPGSG